MPHEYKGSVYLLLIWDSQKRWWWHENLFSLHPRKPTFFFFFFFFWLFRATPVAYGNSQDRNRIGAIAPGLSYSHWPTPQPQQRGIWTHTTAHGNASSWNHWARPRIEPTSSWVLIGFVNHWAAKEIPKTHILEVSVKILRGKLDHVTL